MLEHAMFDRHPSGSQVDKIAQLGTLLAQRQHKEWAVTLYALNNYFVEVWAKDGLEIVGSFHKTANPMAILEPYTADLDVQRLLGVV